MFLLSRRKISLLIQLMFGITAVFICRHNYSSSINLDGISTKQYSLDNSLEGELLLDTGATGIEVKSSNGDSVDVVLSKEGKSVEVRVPVIDNTAPKFTESVKELTLGVGRGNDSDVLRCFKADDRSRLLEYYIIGDINYNVIGEYKVRIACCDSSSNTVTTDLLVKIR